MKKALLVTLASVSVLIVPALSHAATYEYVNTYGNLESVNAATAAEALILPADIAPHSGVMLVTNTGTTIPPITTVITTPAYPTTGTTGTTGYTTTSTATSSGTAAIAGTYTGQLPAINQINSPSSASTTESLSLVLNPNNTATLTTTYATGTPSMIENGTWMLGQNNQLQLTLTGNGTEMYNPAHVIVFTQNSSGELGAQQYDSNMYGSLGFTLSKQNLGTTS